MESRNKKILARPNKIQRDRAANSMRRIARHRIYRLWKSDPRQPEIDLLELSPHDEARVEVWLLQRHGVELRGLLSATGRPPTARCRDRLRYAAWRVLKRRDAVSADFLKAADNRVRAAVRDDARFWKKIDADAGAEDHHR